MQSRDVPRPARVAALLVAGAALSAVTPLAAQSVMMPAPAAASGDKLFGQQCGTCHSIKPGETRVGPSLAHVVGRTAGKLPGYGYSAALKASSVTWNAVNLDRWLTDTNAVVPGNNMTFRETDPAKRKAIIAYLTASSSK